MFCPLCSPFPGFLLAGPGSESAGRPPIGGTASGHGALLLVRITRDVTLRCVASRFKGWLGRGEREGVAEGRGGRTGVGGGSVDKRGWSLYGWGVSWDGLLGLGGEGVGVAG